MAVASRARPGATKAAVVLTLTLLLGIQPITTDLYLPALPGLTRALGASVSAAQLTLSVLIISFGFAQLLSGPLADRYGRRPLLLGGLALYALASALGAFAPTIEWLIAWRALQGIAMAAVVTCGRSVVRDLYDPHEGARMMAYALTGLGAIAMLSPVLGGALAQWLHWRGALIAPAVFSLGTLAYIAINFEETVKLRNRSATRLRPLLRNWAAVGSDSTFWAWTLVSALSFGGLFLYLAGSSFVFIDVLGSSRIAYGFIMAANSLAYVCGTLLCRRLLRSWTLRRTVALGGALSMAGGLSVAALALAGVHTTAAVAVPLWLYAIGHGIHQPCGQAGSVGPFPDKAGTAASLSGFVMMAIAFGGALWLGESADGTVYPLAFGMAAFGIAAAVVAWTLVRRHGEPQPGVEPAAAGGA